MKKCAPKKKYATGGTYQPVGLPVDPATIRQQKIDNRKAEKREFWNGLSTVASFAAPFVAGPLGSAAVGMMNKATAPTMQAPQIQTPDWNTVYDQPNMYGQQSQPMYARTGGDLRLSSSAVQIQGNPGTTDGNYYPSMNAKLDHNEVVSNTPTGSPFIFSDDLKQDGKSFSSMAKLLEKSKGKAEKMLSINPYDEQAKNTIAMSDKALSGLAAQQEQLAMKMGHRNPDGSTKQPGQYRTGGLLNYATGGSDNYQKVGEGTPYYYDPTTQKLYERNPSSGVYAEITGQRSQDLIADWKQSFPDQYARATKSAQPPVNTLGRYIDSQWNLPREVNQPQVETAPQTGGYPVTISGKKSGSAKTATPVNPYLVTQDPALPNPGSYFADYDKGQYLDVSTNPFYKDSRSYEVKQIPENLNAQSQSAKDA